MERTAKERLWLTGGALIAILLLVLGYFLLISPQRDKTSTVNSEIGTVRTQNLSLQQRINNLTAQNKELDKYRADLVDLKLALPSTSGLPDFLRTLQSIGNSTLSDVLSLTVGPPTSVKAAAGGSAQPASTSTSASASGQTAKSARSTGGTNGVYGLAITAAVSGSKTELEQFLQQLQSVQPRAVLVTSISFATAGGTVAATAVKGSATMQITMQAFVSPVSAAEAAQLAKAAGG